MLLRIVVDRSHATAALRLFGRLDAEGLEELQKSYESCTPPIALDLSQLRSIDDVGAAYLDGLVAAGVRVEGSNPYVATLLRLGGPTGRGSGAGSRQ